MTATRFDLAPVTEGAVTVAGVRSPYLTAGPPDADEAIVFVHGNPGPAEDWRRLVARTGAFARAVAPDMPGFGGADKPDGFVYTVDRSTGQVLQAQHLTIRESGGAEREVWVDAAGRVLRVSIPSLGVLAVRDDPPR